MPRASHFLLSPLALIAGVALLHAAAGAHADDGPVRAESLPTSGMLGYESVRLPQGEHMGLVGASLLFDIGGDWGLGPAVYGAATGARGGFFVGGVELQRRFALGRGRALAAGLYVGGGGGAAAPVGGGLMLRPALTLLQDLGPTLQAGLSWSSVRFPSGQIASQQLGVVLAWRNEFRHYAGGVPGDRVESSQAGGLGFDRMALTVGQYRLSDGSARRLGLVGARAERRTGRNGITWGMEAAAAATGDAAGYMELLGTASASVAPLPEALPSFRTGVRVSGGLGGGGAVPTGGGVFGRAVGAAEISPLPGVTVGAELGVVRGASSPFRARLVQAWLAIDLEPGLDGRSAPTGALVRTEWVGALQHHARSERKDGTQRALDTIGLKLNRYVGEHVYLTGQAHSAFAGGAGAYSIGLVGAGAATSARAPWRVGAEVLIGAAGGGGVSTAGGAIAQGVVWAGRSTAPHSEWRIGAGAVRSLRGGLASPVLEIAWSRAFGLAGR